MITLTRIATSTQKVQTDFYLSVYWVDKNVIFNEELV